MLVSFVSTILGSLLSVCITCLLAFAVTLIFRTSTTTNFAQSSIAAFGCYTVAWLFAKGLPVWLGAPVGMIVGAAFGIFIDNFIFRRGRYVGILSKQIITMGFVSVFFGAIPLIFGNPESIPFEPLYNYTKHGVSPNIVIEIAGGELVVTKHALISATITLVVLGAIFYLLKNSKWGLSVRTTASNEQTAQLMGINTHKVTAISWALAAALGVLSAVMYAGSGVMISATFMGAIQVNAFLACILGGFSTFYGPIIGAIIIPVLANAVGFLANFKGLEGIGRWQMVIVYSIILLVILIKPEGLFGKKIVKKV
ncbi:MAG: branched-chain amino acid ABC transporter permease [Clostridiales bacterium]|nr:branched-chain amino acid ABC transporter permease [Clostridiales bacterium]